MFEICVKARKFGSGDPWSCPVGFVSMKMALRHLNAGINARGFEFAIFKNGILHNATLNVVNK